MGASDGHTPGYDGGEDASTPDCHPVTASESRSDDVVDNPRRGSGATESGGKRDYKKGMSRGARDVV